jgi:subtilisin-like proprotein convertase family protein
VRVKAYSSYSNVSLTGSFTAPGGGGGGPQVYTNEDDLVIPDRGKVTSTPLTVSGRTGNASATSKATVHITHPFRGELGLVLIAPDGSRYTLKTVNKRDRVPNVDATYTVNLSTEALNGGWKLEISDSIRGGSGKLTSWSLEF